MEEFVVIEKQRLDNNNLIIKNLCNQIKKSISLYNFSQKNLSEDATNNASLAFNDLNERADELLLRLKAFNDVTKLIEH